MNRVGIRLNLHVAFGRFTIMNNRGRLLGGMPHDSHGTLCPELQIGFHKHLKLFRLKLSFRLSQSFVV